MKSKLPHRITILHGALSCALWVLGCGSGAASNQASRVDVALEPPPGAATATSPNATMPSASPRKASASSSASALDEHDEDALVRIMLGGADNPQSTGSPNLGGSNAAGGLSLGGLPGGGSVGTSTALANGPSSDVTVTGTAQGNVDGFDTALQGMRAAFRRCHNRWLAQDPGAVGSTSLRADLDASGAVTAVTIARPNGRLGDTVACAKGRLSSAQFAAPKQGKGSITVVIDFAIRP